MASSSHLSSQLQNCGFSGQDTAFAIEYETGAADELYCTTPKRRKSDLIAGIDISNPNNRRECHHIETKHGVVLANKERQRVMEEALVEFCVSDCRPFSLINGQGFIQFLNAYSELIIERYLKNLSTAASEILPNEKTISRKVVEILETRQPELHALTMEMVVNGGAVSLDFSQKLGTDYCVIVAHFITKEWY
ncbi:hypothetical protein niasHT_020366 [Heterodera trifolii]|uniref:Hermes trasposase DNA-binding domain-containing protein n=1 Tax=Heterodera trifolii TaxID=157864 RepID=A0ABD2JXF2_9BILA